MRQPRPLAGREFMVFVAARAVSFLGGAMVPIAAAVAAILATPDIRGLRRPEGVDAA